MMAVSGCVKDDQEGGSPQWSSGCSAGSIGMELNTCEDTQGWWWWGGHASALWLSITQPQTPTLATAVLSTGLDIYSLGVKACLNLSEN